MCLCILILPLIALVSSVFNKFCYKEEFRAYLPTDKDQYDYEYDPYKGWGIWNSIDYFRNSWWTK